MMRRTSLQASLQASAIASTKASPRAGTVLIIVAGIIALLSSLAFTFLVRMRSDVEETHGLVADTPARIMLE